MAFFRNMEKGSIIEVIMIKKLGIFGLCISTFYLHGMEKYIDLQESDRKKVVEYFFSPGNQTDIKAQLLEYSAQGDTVKEALQNYVNLFQIDKEFATLGESRVTQTKIARRLFKKFKLKLQDRKNIINIISMLPRANYKDSKLFELFQVYYKPNKLLFYAIKLNRFRAIKGLLKYGADVNVVNNHRRTSLHYSDFKYFIEIITAAYSGQIPLHFAAAYSTPEIVKLLIEHGAEVNAIDNDRRTPLHYAGWANKNPKVIRRLIKNGANVKAIDFYGQTPFDVAVRVAGYTSNPEVIKPFLENANSYRTALGCGLIGIVSMKLDWLGFVPGIAKRATHKWVQRIGAPFSALFRASRSLFKNHFPIEFLKRHQ